MIVTDDFMRRLLAALEAYYAASDQMHWILTGATLRFGAHGERCPARAGRKCRCGWESVRTELLALYDVLGTA